MGKIKRGGYVFVTWIGDHAPRHVHVYKDGKFVGKWDLENSRVMKGRVSREVLKHLAALISEGCL